MVTVAQEREFQQAQAGIRVAVENRLTSALEALAATSTDPQAFRNAVIGITRLVVSQYGEAAADFAADWYNSARVEAGIRDTFAAIPVVQNFDTRIDATVRRVVGTVFTDTPDLASMITGIASKASQYAVDGARNTISENAIRDPRAAGWKRVAHGETCDFCLMLVGRGGVYSREGVVFKSHAGCDCGSVPSWDANAVEVPTIAYEASTGMQNLRDRAAAGNKSAIRQLSAHNDRIQNWITDNTAELAELRSAL